MLGRKLFLLQGADIRVTKKTVHFGAQIPQAYASIAGRAPRDKLRHDIGERRIVVVEALEGDKRADERPCLAGFDPGVSRNRSEFKSFFSATTRFSRRYCATIGAATPRGS